MKLWWHKCTHWEYWSQYVTYAPTSFLWLFWAIKFRTPKFFKHANPGITNGGLYGDSKFEIYELLPDGLFPKTVLADPTLLNDFNKLLNESKLSFPLIVKPDIGLRGIGVQKIYSLGELDRYSKNTKRKFLIQEYIELPNEVGLFYCRMPNESEGKITGLTLKSFLNLQGNGVDTLEQLMKKDPRYEMQISKLRGTIDLSEILLNGDTKCLVPFGNHNRGTQFLDGGHLITEKLEHSFNEILKNVSGFYYGRLDIRYSTFEELEQGINFSIIELNGVKSEPTHIYDPKHSFWYGQSEILRHQLIFRQIAKMNLCL
jgi:Tubulin-tyrosine ligase family